MRNKLKNVFSDEMFSLGGKIEFQDKECYKRFIEAVQTVREEGKEMGVEGITSVNTNIKCGSMEYPTSTYKEFGKVIISPSTEKIPIIINTEYGNKTIVFKRYQTTNEIICETEKDEIVYLKIVFKKDTLISTFHYRTQLEHAKVIKDIVESYTTTIKFLEKLFNYNKEEVLADDYDIICNARAFFREGVHFFKKLYLLEQELGISFKIEDLEDNENEVIDIEELYFLIVKKKVIRLNAKLKANEYTELTMIEGESMPEIGSAIELTFLGKIEYNVYGQRIVIYTANLLSNAIIKEIEENNRESVKLLYSDTDSHPMYISLSGFKTENEAKKEMEAIMKRKEKYIEALTINEYIECEVKYM